MPVVMDHHGLRVDMRLERVVGIAERRQLERPAAAAPARARRPRSKAGPMRRARRNLQAISGFRVCSWRRFLVKDGGPGWRSSPSEHRTPSSAVRCSPIGDREEFDEPGQARPLRHPRFGLGALERVLSQCSAPKWCRAARALRIVSATAAQSARAGRRCRCRSRAMPVQPGQQRSLLRVAGPDRGRDRAFEALRSHDRAWADGALRRQGGGTSVYFRDPDGSLMEFISYPHKSR